MPRPLLDRAQQLAPDSAVARASKATFAGEGRLDEAAQELSRFRKTRRMIGSLTPSKSARRSMNATSMRLFRFIERKLTADAGQPLTFSTSSFWSILVTATNGWDTMRKRGKRLHSRRAGIKPTPETGAGPDANGTPTTLALAYAGLGEKEKALAQAQQAVKDYATTRFEKPWAETTLARFRHASAITTLPSRPCRISSKFRRV